MTPEILLYAYYLDIFNNDFRCNGGRSCLFETLLNYSATISPQLSKSLGNSHIIGKNKVATIIKETCNSAIITPVATLITCRHLNRLPLFHSQNVTLHHPSICKCANPREFSIKAVNFNGAFSLFLISNDPSQIPMPLSFFRVKFAIDAPGLSHSTVPRM